MSAGVSNTSFNVCGKSQNCVGCYIGYPQSVVCSPCGGRGQSVKGRENIPWQPSKSWSHNGDLVLIPQVETMILCLWENCLAGTPQPVASAGTNVLERCGLGRGRPDWDASLELLCSLEQERSLSQHLQKHKLPRGPGQLSVSA